MTQTLSRHVFQQKIEIKESRAQYNHGRQHLSLNQNYFFYTLFEY